MAKKLVVLAVDDKIEVLTGISEILNQDYDVRAVKNAAAAMSLLRSEKVDLIILDIDMPVLSGFDFYSFIKRNSNTTRIPVIFITAVTDPDVIKKAGELDAAAFIAKPFTAELLHMKIKNIIGI